MSDGDLLLGIDVGTSTIKAGLMDGDGAEVAIAREDTPFVSSGGNIEMSREDLRAALGRVLNGLGAARRGVAAAGVAGVAESGAPLGASGDVIAPVVAWHDPRGEETVALLKRRFGDELPARIGRRMRTVSSAAKLGWLIDHGCGRVTRWLGVPELCLWELTRAQATEHSLASRTGWYDVSERTYMPEVAEAIGANEDVFAPVERAGAVLGRVTAGAASWSGLPQGTPVTLAGHDHLAGAQGVGAGYEDLANSVGTAETMLRPHPALPHIATALELNAAVSVRPGGEGWVVFASAARAGVVLRTAARALGRDAADLDALAEGARSVDGSALLSRIERDGRPTMPEASPGGVWKGLLEALVERSMEARQRLARLLGPERRVLVFGGGARSGPWVRVKAERAGVPLWRTRQEAVARGAALFGGVAAGWWPAADDAPAPNLERVDGTVRASR